MLFTLIFVALFVAGWSFCGLVPWVVNSAFTRGQAGLGYLPLSIFAANVAGAAVPVLGADDARGLWLSFLAAALVPSLLLAIRRFAAGGPGNVHEPPGHADS